MKDNYHILIVEDEFVLAHSLKTSLEAWLRVKCNVVSTGASALQEFERAKFDLVLIDIGLPDGPDGIQTGKQMLEQRKLPLVFLSGYSDRETMNRADGLNYAAFLVKPIDETLVCKEVQRLLPGAELP